MIIEIFPNMDGVIGSFRHSRSNTPSVKPIKKNVYTIDRYNLKDLILALDHTAIVGSKEDHNFNSGNLYLKIIDNANYNHKKGKFMDNALNIK